MVYTLQYYDLVLACIGVSLALGAGVGSLTLVPLETSFLVFGLLGILFVVHALWVNGPIDEVDDLTEPVEPKEVPQILSPIEASEETESAGG